MHYLNALTDGCSNLPVRLRRAGYAAGCAVLWAISGWTLVACGPHLVKGKAPFVSISSVLMGNESLSASFDIRNINDVPLEIDFVAVSIYVRDAQLILHEEPMALVIDPNTTEVIAVEKLLDESARSLLDSLESGGVQSLPITLDGRVHSPEEGNLVFRNEGHLYRVPGRPGQFRSASSAVTEPR